MHSYASKLSDKHNRLDPKIPGAAIALFLFGLAAEFSPIQNTALSVVLLAMAFVVIGMGLLMSRISKTNVDGQPALVVRLPQLKRSSKKDLRKQALDLSKELFDFTSKRRKHDPGLTHSSYRASSAEERDKAWDAYTKLMINYSTETMSNYNAQYLTRALVLHDAFKEKGLTAGDERHWFEHPTNILGIERVATELGTWARKL